MRQRRQFDWLRPYLDLGFTAEFCKSGHWKIRDPEGNYVMSMSNSPSCRHGMNNAERMLRRRLRERSIPDERAG
jgi:hypothetical protein